MQELRNKRMHFAAYVAILNFLQQEEKHLVITNALKTKTSYINIMGTIQDCVCEKKAN